ncbi:uncharacterized protein LOC123315892 [Coccinella septempunctata]|uniref:uncharacterized protein LOC123315892 n=1 Tax=Coccinella septempunctata TaxID=41139 RepID=UPI001D09232D|nr:uncharacterized protein LOC123315892 [Coccinella septempunctata]
MGDRKLKNILAQRDLECTKLEDLKRIADYALSDIEVHRNFKCRYKYIEDILKSFETFNTAIVSIVSGTEGGDLKPHYDALSTFRDKYYRVQAIYSQLFEDKLETSKSEEENSSHSKVRLPKLELPTFDGDIRNWQTFCDVFESLIHNNPTLSNVDKYSYLLSCLKGNALSVVKCTPLTGNNYIIAFNALKKRYENKRLIATAHWHTITKSKPVNVSENPRALRNLIDTFSENLKALENLKFPSRSGIL